VSTTGQAGAGRKAGPCYTHAVVLWVKHGIFSVPGRVIWGAKGDKDVQPWVPWKTGYVEKDRLDDAGFEEAWQGREDAPALLPIIPAWMAIHDPDSPEAEARAAERANGRTVAFTSKKGTKRLYRISGSMPGQVRPDGSGDEEIRTGGSGGLLMIFPPTHIPSSNGYDAVDYEYLPSCSFDDVDIAPAPSWMKRELSKAATKTKERTEPVTVREWGTAPERLSHEWAKSVLGKLAGGHLLSRDELHEVASALNVRMDGGDRQSTDELADLVDWTFDQEQEKRRKAGTEPRLFLARTLGEVIDDIARRPPRRFLVEGLITEGSYGAWGSVYKGQKSLDVIDLGVSVVTGTPFLGRFPIGVQGSFLIIYCEGDDVELTRRIQATAASRGLSYEDLRDQLHIVSSIPKLLNPESMAQVEDEVERIRPTLWVLDPFYLSAGGADMKNLFAMGEALGPLQVINEDARSTFGLSHHFSRDTSKRGIDRFSGSGIPEWARWLGAAEITQRKPIENGSQVVRRVEFTGSSVAEHRFTVTRKVGSFDPTDANSRMWIETTTADLADESERVVAGNQLGPAQHRVYKLLYGVDRPQDVSDIQQRTEKDGGEYPLKTRTVEAALDQLAKFGLADATNRGPGGPRAEWWRTDGQ
jgi:hypothetical protein